MAEKTELPSFAQRLQHDASRIETTLDAILAEAPALGEICRPERLLAAMRHAVFAGGKRLRPILVLETARLFGREDDGVLGAAAALECIHCYSLAHDDLPAMDDDDMRRGKPTVHKAFDEATAILAGDALLTLAFDLIAADAVHADAGVRLRLSRDLARASGFGGMAGGQMLDLEAETGAHQTEAMIRRLQSMKTGALLKYACRSGAILADATADDLKRLDRFGEIIGLAYQLADDLLDAEAPAEVVGKATGKDAGAGKATLVQLLGPDRTRDELKRLIEEANVQLAPYGEASSHLRNMAAYIIDRTH